MGEAEICCPSKIADVDSGCLAAAGKLGDTARQTTTALNHVALLLVAYLRGDAKRLKLS
jgi:hypothetical protein